MRVGLKTETGRVVTAQGVKPIAKVEWKRENFWVYGVVEPLSGWHFEQEYGQLNSEHFQSFIDALSVALGQDCALMQLVHICMTSAGVMSTSAPHLKAWGTGLQSQVIKT
jgi:hypothetical protein